MLLLSVIIPVFNAARFIESAVKSALDQSEVGEVILVEDGSTDESLIVCKKLAHTFDKVILLQHPEGKNHGVCHSRNLGIKNAKFDFIAFLDSDDWYLPNRFAKEKELFENPEVMAVYSLCAILFPDGREELFGSRINMVDKLGTKNVNEVYCHRMRNDIILGDTNSCSFRKVIFDGVGFFDPRLRIHEDTEFWNRIARSYLFYPGELGRPVSMARKHENNTITKRSKHSQLYFLWVWIDNIGVSNLMACERENLVYLYSRALTNPIRPHFIRKIAFKGFNSVLILSKTFFSNWFYRMYGKSY